MQWIEQTWHWGEGRSLGSYGLDSDDVEKRHSRPGHRGTCCSEYLTVPASIDRSCWYSWERQKGAGLFRDLHESRVAGIVAFWSQQWRRKEVSGWKQADAGMKRIRSMESSIWSNSKSRSIGCYHLRGVDIDLSMPEESSHLHIWHWNNTETASLAHVSDQAEDYHTPT